MRWKEPRMKLTTLHQKMDLNIYPAVPSLAGDLVDPLDSFSFLSKTLFALSPASKNEWNAQEEKASLRLEEPGRLEVLPKPKSEA